jgi:hypothetical protein
MVAQWREVPQIPVRFRGRGPGEKMEKCNYSEGYLLMYLSGGDEIHLDLISEEHYNSGHTIM